MTVTKTVYNYLDTLKDGTIISGWSLFDKINSITGKKTYPSTLLSYARIYCDLVGGKLECINPQESKYKFHSGCCKLGNAIISGKE